MEYKKSKGRQICLALIAAALLSDLFQMHGVVFSHDLRLWQLWVGLGAVGLLAVGRLGAYRIVIIPATVVALHTLIIMAITGSVVYFSWLQLILVMLVALVCYSALVNYAAPQLASIYLFCALVVAGSIFAEQLMNIFLPEFASSIDHIIKRAHGPWGLIRGHGLMMEPSQVALIAPPALFVALMRRKKLVASVLVLACALSFSALTYLGVVTAFVVYILVTRGIKIGQLFCVFMLTLGVAIAVEPVRDRVEWVSRAPLAVRTLDQSRFEELHLDLGGSVGAQVVAARVMLIGFQSNGFLGTGLGNFRAAGREFRDQISPEVWTRVQENTNLDAKLDTGASLLLRMLGELGILGLMVIFYGAWHVTRLLTRVYRLCRSDPGWRYDPRVQIIGLFVVIVVPYLVRKDGYLNVYLLLPLAGYLYASSSLPWFSKMPLAINGEEGQRVDSKLVDK